jgi:hypothetical protein
MKSGTLAATLTLLLFASAHAAAQTPTPAQTPAARPTPQATPPPPAPRPTPTTAARPSQTPAAPKTSPAEAKKTYEALLEKAKKGEGTVDYGALRFAYFETPEYSPMEGMTVYRALWGAAAQSNWPEAAKQAEAVLAKNYVDVNAHMVAHVAYRQQGDEEKAKLHRRWADGLLDSIRSGGDGKTPQTAWHVISISEEYAVFRALNLRPVGQALVRADDHAYDEIRVIDPQTNAEVKYYFNVDKPFSAYGRK